MRTKRIKGFATGDLVQAKVPSGKKTGIYRGRVAIRATGSFNIQTDIDIAQGISYRYCTLLQRADGYGYTQQQSIKLKEAGQESLCGGFPVMGTPITYRGKPPSRHTTSLA